MHITIHNPQGGCKIVVKMITIRIVMTIQGISSRWVCLATNHILKYGWEPDHGFCSDLE